MPSRNDSSISVNRCSDIDFNKWNFLTIILVLVWFVRWHFRQSKDREKIEEDPRRGDENGVQKYAKNPKVSNPDKSYQPKELVSATPQANTYFFPRLDSLSDVFSGEVRHGAGLGDMSIFGQ